MSSAFANRATRRRGIVFTVLLVVTVLMMAFSSNPGVRDLQSGVGYAFRPIQGALDSVAGGIASVATAITEIDRLRTDNAQLRDQNERLTTENAQVDEIRRENDLLTGLLQLQAGFSHKTAAAAVSAAIRSAPPGRDDRQGDQCRHRARRQRGHHRWRSRGGSRSRPDSAVRAADRCRLDVVRPARPTRRGAGRRQLGGVMVMSQIDSGEKISLGDRSSRPASSSRAAPLARSPRPPSSARSSTSASTPTTSSDRLPAINRRSRQARVRPHRAGLRGRPAADQPAASGLAVRACCQGERLHAGSVDASTSPVGW